jgi:hypothetical protein
MVQCQDSRKFLNSLGEADECNAVLRITESSSSTGYGKSAAGFPPVVTAAGRDDFLREWLCTPCRVISEPLGLTSTGIDPRHRARHLSLLPSGSDEVRDCLLRSVRSAIPRDSKSTLKEEFSPA